MATPTPAVDSPAADALAPADPSHLAHTLLLVRDLHVATAESNYRQIKRITAELAAAGKTIVPEMLGHVPLVVPVAEVKRELNQDGLSYAINAREGLVTIKLHDAAGEEALVAMEPASVRVLVGDLLGAVAEVER